MSCKQKRMVPGVVYLQYRMRKSGGCAGEGLGGGGPRGPGLAEKACRAGRGQLAGWMQMSERIFPAAGYGFASVRISEKHIRPQKKFPGAGPRADCICNTGCENRGPVPGKVSQGEAWRGVPLLKRPTPPRSFPLQKFLLVDHQGFEPWTCRL